MTTLINLQQSVVFYVRMISLLTRRIWHDGSPWLSLAYVQRSRS